MHHRLVQQNEMQLAATASQVKKGGKVINMIVDDEVQEKDENYEETNHMQSHHYSACMPDA